MEHTTFSTDDVSSWVKRLGQWHIYSAKHGECLCGQVALGNNYARVIPVDKRVKCPECWAVVDNTLK
jgi:hypothetical protein